MAQTIVARQIEPGEPAAHTFGSRNTGTKNTITPESAEPLLQSALNAAAFVAPHHRDHRSPLPYLPTAALAPVRAENPVTVSEQHVPGSRPRHHRPNAEPA